MLSGRSIKREIEAGRIKISPFSEDQLNPNSYDLRLNEKLLVYKDAWIDSKQNNPTREIIIPETGLFLNPGELYLARTEEYTETDGFVPVLNGKSSIGRLGITIHVTAGFGDVGFRGFWTLEITAVKRVCVYPKMKICQICYHPVDGEYDRYDSVKYQGNTGVQASQSWRDFSN